MKTIIIAFALSLALSACCATPDRATVVEPLPMPVRPVLPGVAPHELACMPADAYQRLYDRQRLLFEYTENLEAIIRATQAPVNGTGKPDTSSGRTHSRDARGGV